MNELTFVCDYTIFDNYKCKIFKNDDFFLNAEVDLYSNIKSIIKDKSLYQSKISVTDESENEIINIYKYSKLALNNKLFSIEYDDKSFFVREDNNFRIPDLYIRTKLDKLSIYGKLSTQEFKISIKDQVLANIKGSFKEKSKEYKLIFDDKYKDYEKLFISAVLVLDNLYHDY